MTELLLNSRHVTEGHSNQVHELSKEDREQALAECRKRCGIIPGQMAVLKDPSPWLYQVGLGPLNSTQCQLSYLL